MKQKTSNIIFSTKLAFTGILLFLCSVMLAQPVAKFTASPSSACAPVLVQFTDLSSGRPSGWKWDLGNGTISYLKNPSVTYFTPGLYTIKLLVQNSEGSDSVVKTNYITVYSAPIVNFTSVITSGCNPLRVKFTDLSTTAGGTISTWQWDFGDGSLSGEKSPEHTYTTPGNYNVTLKVTNNNGCVNTLLRTNYITVSGVEAGFSNDIPASCNATSIHFQNTSSGNGILSYRWSFGDGNFSTAANPTHTFTTGGRFSVKLFVLNNTGCADSIIKNIRLDTIVSAAFSASATTSCKAPMEVHFTNQVLSHNSYWWSFGDSTSSGESNPTHLFTDTGSFSVKLIVTNSNGCIDSLYKKDFIKIHKQSLVVPNLPDSGCIPLTRNFYASNNSAERVVNYLWNFGDGTTSANTSPTHTYRSAGLFDISLITMSAGGCVDTVYVAKGIKVNSKPAANFKADVTNTCARNMVSFTDLSTGGATAWEWYFGDGSASFEQNPVHGYKDTGFMTVILIVKNGGCTDTATFNRYIYIKPAIAKFQEYYNCTNPFSVTFKDFSKGADSWYWDFGDSTHSVERNPIHVYNSPGRYTVTLKVVNNLTGCTHGSSKVIIVLGIRPDFFASDTIACKGSEITFKSSLDVNDVIRFIWDYGDGTVFSIRNNTVKHIYTKPGTYSVKLTIILRTVICRDSLVKEGYIRIDGPVAKFSPQAYAAEVNTNVNFIDSSENDGLHPIQSWKWHYGDGRSEVLGASPFTHSYTSTGQYFVQLQLTDSKGCTDSLSLLRPLVISETKARFISADSVSCPGKAIHFTNQSYGSNLSYRWSFGDGLFSADHDPVHTYSNPGNYDIKLVATDEYGFSDSMIKRAYISLHYPAALFNMSDSFRDCPPLIIQFTDASSRVLSRVWDFGDGSSSTLLNPSHFYTYPGVYSIKLSATGPGGCSSEQVKQITVKGPRGTLHYNPLNSCKPYVVNFTAQTSDAVSYIWDFNDGTTLSNSDTSLAHTFLHEGNYIPKLMLVDSAGCRIPITGSDTIHAISVSAKFSFTDSMYCNTTSVSFTNTSATNDTQSSCLWNFGDGTFSTEKNPVHQYTAQGTYLPALKVRTRFGCEDSVSASVPVRIGHAPDISISASANSGCSPLLVTLKAVPGENDGAASLHWSLGNDHTSAEQNPQPQNYTAPGLYTIALTAINNTGCSKTVTSIIEVLSTPVIHAAGSQVICRGSSTALQATGASNYNWFPSVGLSCTNCASTVATPGADTRYSVTATAANGCIAVDSVFVRVKQPVKINYNNSVVMCTGQSKRLSASGAARYSWLPAEGLSSTAIANPVARPDSTTTYRVIGTDDMNCFTDTGFITVKVFQYPTVDAGPDKSINAGQPVDLIPAFSGDVTEINWSPTSGLFRNSNASVTVKPTVTTEYTVEVKNAGGCTANDKVTVSVLCDGSNVFIPNTFSPNNDGANDIFYPRGTGIFKIKTLKIFNRWGQAVFEKTNFNANDPSAGWDGAFKGQKLAADVYIYFVEIICNNNTLLNFNGNIALVQ